MNGVLRPWRRSDAAALIEARRSDPDLGMQFGGAALDRLADAETYIDEVLSSGATRRAWAITIDDVAVGNVALSAIEQRHGTAWASYWLRADVRGHGLAARALATVSAWAFTHTLFRLELGHRVNNPASCRVARRAGYLAEGIERQKLRYGDARFDVETHARLATDPEPTLDPLPLRD